MLLAISRLLRLEKATELMTNFIDTSESEVAHQIYEIATSLLLTIYSAAGILMVLENFTRDS